jgi:hypothetical protein
VVAAVVMVERWSEVTALTKRGWQRTMAALPPLSSRRAAAEAEGQRATRPAQWPSLRFGLGLLDGGFSSFGDNENSRTAALGEEQETAVDRNLNDLSVGFHGNLVATKLQLLQKPDFRDMLWLTENRHTHNNKWNK